MWLKYICVVNSDALSDTCARGSTCDVTFSIGYNPHRDMYQVVLCIIVIVIIILFKVNVTHTRLMYTIELISVNHYHFDYRMSISYLKPTKNDYLHRFLRQTTSHGSITCTGMPPKCGFYCHLGQIITQ